MTAAPVVRSGWHAFRPNSFAQLPLAKTGLMHVIEKKRQDMLFKWQPFVASPRRELQHIQRLMLLTVEWRRADRALAFRINPRGASAGAAFRH